MGERVSKETYGVQNCLVYQLDHKHTDTSLKFESLKGLDKTKADIVK